METVSSVVSGLRDSISGGGQDDPEVQVVKALVNHDKSYTYKVEFEDSKRNGERILYITMFKTHGDVENATRKDGETRKDSVDIDQEGKGEVDKDANKETRRDPDRETRRERERDRDRDREGRRRPDSTTRKADTETYHTYYLTGDSDQEIAHKFLRILKKSDRNEKSEKGSGDWRRQLKETDPRHLL